ncbi:LacI family DNA-binding transcriptional regulator [Bacillaceae bacterium Marseille-Q3522]|nr:LacI family DNA-binding transcriptional regulator [Bacillaceae bacterium Marseille-Q3522]
MITIQKVAELAGVSVATVSRVINQKKAVSAKTREKVEKVMKEMQYEPNMLGRNLRTSQSNLIIVMVPTISNPFYVKIMKGIEDAALKEGFHIMLCMTDSQYEREEAYFHLIRQKLADGIISLDPGTNFSKLLNGSKKYPIIQCCEYSELEDVPYVAIDNKEAAYKASKHLIQLGHKRIALINTDEHYIYASHRKQGYLQALKDYQIPALEEYMLNVELNFEHGQRGMRKLLQLKEKPTAVFCVSDILAVGAIKEIMRGGYKIPQDIAVAGFDNIEFSYMMNPTLTTIAQPMYEMGAEAGRMLIQQIKNKEEKIENLLLDYELIIRESTMG